VTQNEKYLYVCFSLIITNVSRKHTDGANVQGAARP